VTRKAWPYAVTSAACCALGLGVALVLPEPSRTPAIFGAAASSLGALCAFTALAASAGRSLNGVLAGFVIGFLCRALLVGVGLVASGAKGGGALTYVFCFFALYAATQVVEVLLVRASAQGATP
jgi:dolichol kinase